MNVCYFCIIYLILYSLCASIYDATGGVVTHLCYNVLQDLYLLKSGALSALCSLNENRSWLIPLMSDSSQRCQICTRTQRKHNGRTASMSGQCPTVSANKASASLESCYILQYNLFVLCHVTISLSFDEMMRFLGLRLRAVKLSWILWPLRQHL